MRGQTRNLSCLLHILRTMGIIKVFEGREPCSFVNRCYVSLDHEFDYALKRANGKMMGIAFTPIWVHIIIRILFYLGYGKALLPSFHCQDPMRSTSYSSNNLPSGPTALVSKIHRDLAFTSPWCLFCCCTFRTGGQRQGPYINSNQLGSIHFVCGCACVYERGREEYDRPGGAQWDFKVRKSWFEF